MAQETMPDVDHLLQAVIREARTLNIPVSSRIDPRVKISTRAKARLGCCRKDMKRNDFAIELSEMVLCCEVHKIKEILAHEILHTCEGCCNHGKLWKEYAGKMNETYGYVIKRTADFEEMGLQRARKEPLYLLQCTSCKKIIERRKKSRLVKYPYLYRCSCGGRLKLRKTPTQKDGGFALENKETCG